MSLIAKGSTFTPAPEGQYVAVCADVVDLGIVETTWQNQKKRVHKCRLVFEIDERMESGRRYTVSSQFTVSLDEKANLRKFLESWRGKPFTSEELKGFDVEQLWGKCCVIQIVHNPKGDKIYANINSVMKIMKGMAVLTPSKEYIRVKDREPEPVAAVAQGTHDDEYPYDEQEDTSDDLPF